MTFLIMGHGILINIQYLYLVSTPASTLGVENWKVKKWVSDRVFLSYSFSSTNKWSARLQMQTLHFQENLGDSTELDILSPSSKISYISEAKREKDINILRREAEIRNEKIRIIHFLSKNHISTTDSVWELQMSPFLQKKRGPFQNLDTRVMAANFWVAMVIPCWIDLNRLGSKSYLLDTSANRKQHRKVFSTSDIVTQ